ncbi:hypothetical protein LTR08_003149 [Meristemomyces frigidus]|nr:hypothetical protein LTR08_003149 [Meristemomyces frigidus]
MRISLLALAGTTTAQRLLPSSPRGAVPVGVQAPGLCGFENPTIGISRGGLAVCVSGTVSVTASTSKNLKFNYQLPRNQIEVTETFLEIITAGSPATKELVAGLQNVTGTYSIGATLCTPANDTSPKGVQLLTHGVGFDRYYWDFAPGYSYVDVAVANGYAAFFYDRLGVGVSDRPDALDVVQAPFEVEIAHGLTGLLRQGAYSNITFDKVVGVGHSFGSIITQAVTTLYPSDFDAAILTGFSISTSGQPAFLTDLNLAIASQNQPYRFAGLTNGYLVSGTAISNQIGFFRAPSFDPSILSLAEAEKNTATFGELFTLSAVTVPALGYVSPVAIVNGGEDLPFCDGNCSYPTNLAAAVQPALYPNISAANFGSYLAPATGHGLNLHYTAVSAYAYIQSFLRNRGLGM